MDVNKDIVDKMLEEIISKITIDERMMTIKDLPDYNGWKIKEEYFAKYCTQYSEDRIEKIDPLLAAQYRENNPSDVSVLTKIEICLVEPTPKRVFIFLKNLLLRRKVHYCNRRVSNYFYSVPSCSRIVVFRGTSGATIFFMDLSGKKITPSFHNIYAIEIEGERVLVGRTGVGSYFINRYTGKEIEIKETINRPDEINSAYKTFRLGNILLMYDEMRLKTKL